MERTLRTGFIPRGRPLGLHTAMRWNVLKPADPMVTLHRLFIGNGLLLGVGFALLAAFCTRHLHRTWLAFPAVCPGFLWLAVALVAPVYLSNWSISMAWKLLSNSFALAWRCLPLQRVHAPAFDYRFPCSSSVSRSSAGLTTFFSPADSAPHLALPKRTPPPSNRLGRCIASGNDCRVPRLHPHLGCCSMPTSGSVKAGLSIVGNLHFFDQAILPKNWFLTRGPTWLFSEIFMRVFQMICSRIHLWHLPFRRRRSALDLVEALCFGVILKAL